MPNIPKPDLERGNYLCYTDEPNTIVDNSGGGESYEVMLVTELTSGNVSEYASFPFFSVNGEPVTGFAEEVEPDQPYRYAKTVTVSQDDIFAFGEIEGYIVDDMAGTFTCPIPTDQEFCAFPSKKIADYYAQVNSMEIPTVKVTYESD